MNITDIIIEENAQRGDNIAVSEPGKQLSYATLSSATEEISASLSNKGIKQCDRVALYYEDGIDYILLSLAVLKLNAVIVPISPSYSFDDIESAMHLIDTEWLITKAPIDLYNDYMEIDNSILSNKKFFLHSRQIESTPPDEYFQCNPAFVRFSSGTTGVSKGVVISNEAIIDRTNAANKALGINENDTVLWLLSMSFHFVVTILLFLREGARIEICSDNFPSNLLSSLKTSNGTFIYASPFHYKFMTESADFKKDSLSNLRMAVSTAMSLSETIAKGFADKFDFELSQAYGIIEVGLPFIETASTGHREGSVGRIGPDYEISFQDDGEILLRGKGMFTAYFSPWQTLEDIDSEGWFHTGDIGRLDDDFLFIEGRKKELINFAGMKIFPAEVEQILNSHESIKESQVYPIPDDTYGQLPAARVMLTTKDFDEKSVRRFCYSLLPSYKVPKSFEVVDNIDKTHSGKIRR